MEGLENERGVLYPQGLPSFHRLQPPAHLQEVIRWFWIPRWEVPPGAVHRIPLLPFPASNLVVEAGQLQLCGPTSSVSFRELTGRGWAVGALLRPAGLAALEERPSLLRDAEKEVEAPSLLSAVGQAMNAADPLQGHHFAARAFQEWAVPVMGAADAQGRLANRMEDLIAGDRELVRVDQLAQRLGVGERSVQRLAHRYVGLTPLAMIRRYRLQEGAQRLRQEPGLVVARLASELGYSDQAHFGRDFRATLGLTPTAYAAAFDREHEGSGAGTGGI